VWSAQLAEPTAQQVVFVSLINPPDLPERWFTPARGPGNIYLLETGNKHKP
jgi:hypothetical protein